MGEGLHGDGSKGVRLVEGEEDVLDEGVHLSEHVTAARPVLAAERAGEKHGEGCCALRGRHRPFTLTRASRPRLTPLVLVLPRA